MAADRKQARAADGLLRTRAEPADSTDDRPRPDGRRVFPPARALVGTGARRRTMGAARRLLQGRRAGVCVFPDGRPGLSVLPFWIVHQYISVALWTGAAVAGSNPAGDLSLEHALSRGFSGRAVQAGEVDLPFRSAAGAGDFAAHLLVEAAVPGNPRLWLD